MRHISDDILTRIIDCYTGNGSPQEQRVLEEWVAGSPDNERAFRDCLCLLNDITLTERALSLGEVKRLEKASRRGIRRRRVWMAAAAVAVVCAGLFLFRWGGTEPSADAVRPGSVTITRADGSVVVLDRNAEESRIALQADVDMVQRGASLAYAERQAETPADSVTYPVLTVPVGATFDIVLEDGTHIWLNAASRLRFPSRFTRGERRVQLEGEAYFEVTPDPSAPFVLDVAGQSLTVLGTHFNVQAYGGEPSVVTTLIEGSVRVEAEGGEGRVLLPGEQSRLDLASRTFSVGRVDTGDFTSWKDGLIGLDGLTLDEVFAKLSRWYGVRFSVADEGIRGIVLEGAIPSDNDIQAVMKILESVSRIKFKVKNDVIEVKAR